MLPRGSIACFAPANPHLKFSISPDLGWIPIERHARANDAQSRVLPGALGSLSAFAVESYRAVVDTRRLAAKAARFGREFGADAVWCVLEGPTMIRLAVAVSEALRVPLYTKVWDPPHYWFLAYGLDQASSAMVLKDFGEALRRSAACFAGSWAMAEQYHRDYGTRTVPFVATLDVSLAVPPAREIHRRSELVIGMAGQVYAKNEWKVLMEALDAASWNIGGRQVRIRLLGSSIDVHAHGAARIEFLGWHGQADTVKLLAEADVLYCPYRFGREFEPEARLCFPSKLTTYLAAGRPVLFHGPDYASPARFLREHDAGLCCHSLEPGDVHHALLQLATDPGLYHRLTANGRAAFNKHLTSAEQRRRFAEFLGIPENILIPSQRR